MRDHVLIQRQGGAMTLYGGAMLYTTTWYTGPGVLLSKQVWGDATQFEMIANTPIGDGRIKAWHGCLVKSATGTITAEDKEMAKAIQAGALEAFSKDFEIWQHKKPALKPMAMKTEGPFLKGRKWYSQFYADRADVKSTQDAVNGLYHVPGVQTPAERNHAIDEGLPI
jgi:3-ketosteroid 9alpha-monooxygenase subunit A